MLTSSLVSDSIVDTLQVCIRLFTFSSQDHCNLLYSDHSKLGLYQYFWGQNQYSVFLSQFQYKILMNQYSWRHWLLPATGVKILVNSQAAKSRAGQGSSSSLGQGSKYAQGPCICTIIRSKMSNGRGLWAVASSAKISRGGVCGCGQVLVRSKSGLGQESRLKMGDQNSWPWSWVEVQSQCSQHPLANQELL